MQYINHWPDITQLVLPQAVTQDIHQQLLLPFSCEAEAKAFWRETLCTLIIPDETDTIISLKIIVDPAFLPPQSCCG